MASITTYCDASWISRRHATRRSISRSHLGKQQVRSGPARNFVKSARECRFSTTLRLLQRRCKCCISAYVCGRPPKILPIRRGANRSKERQNRGTGTPASLRPQRASALAFFGKKKRQPRARRRSTFERWPVTAGLSCCRRELLRIALRAHAAATPRRKRCKCWLEAGGRRRAHRMLTERPPRGRRRDRRAARRLT